MITCMCFEWFSRQFAYNLSNGDLYDLWQQKKTLQHFKDRVHEFALWL